MIILWFILGIIAYLAMGRIMITLIENYSDYLEFDGFCYEWYKGWATVFFPIVVLWIFACWIADLITGQ